MNKQAIVGAAIVILLVAGGAVALTHKADNNKRATQSTSSPQSNPSTNPTPASSSQTSSTGSIDIKNMMFMPPQISIQKGGTVTWTNNDSVAHTVTDDLKNVGGPDSPSIAPGAKYSFTFDKTGSFQYHCTFHSSMRGTIVVK